jgi:predicted anti-sigma-YlaC factor YlaD
LIEIYEELQVQKQTSLKEVFMKNLAFDYRFAQIVLALTGVFYLLSSVALLFAPVWFFQTIGHFPPFNRHYEGDTGAFVFALGAGLLFAAPAPSRHTGVVWVAAIASLLHACNHIYDAIISQARLSVWYSEIGSLLVVALLLIIVAIISSRLPVKLASLEGTQSN